MTRANLHCLLDRIPESELPIAERFLQFLSNEPIGPRFAQSIRKGIAEADDGNIIIRRDLDEMTEKILASCGGSPDRLNACPTGLRDL
jgi:hypothetical protein